MSERLDTRRASYASRAILGRFERPKKELKDLKEYRSVVLNAPSFLRQCGLLQLAAFYVSKSGANGDVLKDITGWLNDSKSPSYFICIKTSGTHPRQPIEGADLNTVRALSERTSQELALLEQETDAILIWLKRLTEAKYKEIKELNPIDSTTSPSRE